MKRDFDLLRNILIAVYNGDFLSVDSEKYFGHIHLLLQDKWIRWKDEFSTELKLLPKGLNVLNLISDGENWEKIKDFLLSKDIPIYFPSIETAHKVLLEKGIIKMKRFF